MSGELTDENGGTEEEEQPQDNHSDGENADGFFHIRTKLTSTVMRSENLHLGRRELHRVEGGLDTIVHVLAADGAALGGGVGLVVHPVLAAFESVGALGGAGGEAEETEEKQGGGDFSHGAKGRQVLGKGKG